jgi:membrane AbrB-like protein
MTLLIAVAVGLLGALVGSRSGLPGGTIFGAIFATAAFKLLYPGGVSRLPDSLEWTIFAVLGIQVGLTMDRGTLAELKEQWALLGLLAVSVYAAAMLAVWVIARVAKVDVPSALLAGSPGGFSGITGVALEAGANTAQVVAVHTIRLVLVYASLPFILSVVRPKG